jgi:hypothetical protein
MLAVNRASAMYAHFFQGVLGEPQPGSRFRRIQKWGFGFFLFVVGHVLRRLFLGSSKCECEKKRRQDSAMAGVAKMTDDEFATPGRQGWSS